MAAGTPPWTNRRTGQYFFGAEVVFPKKDEPERLSIEI